MHSRNEDQSLYELIATLASRVGDVNGQLHKHNLCGLSYGEAHPSLPNTDATTYNEARAAAIEAAEKILHTLRGPREILLDISFQVCYVTCWKETWTNDPSALRFCFLANHPELWNSTSHSIVWFDHVREHCREHR